MILNQAFIANVVTSSSLLKLLLSII